MNGRHNVRTETWVPLFLAALLFAGTFVSKALACGPTRHKHTTSVNINAPANRVWAIVGNYADFNWTGKIVRTQASGDAKPDVARRTWFFASGAAFSDQLTMLDDNDKTIAFLTDKGDITALPVSNYASRISVLEQDGRTTVEWRGAFVRGFPNNNPPPELSDAAAIAAVTAFQKSALENLKLMIEAGH